MFSALFLALTAQAEPPPPLTGCWSLQTRGWHRVLGELSLTVEGSAVGGTVTLHGEAQPIREGTVTGTQFRLSLSDTQTQLEGELSGSELQGTVTRGSTQLSWTATRCPVPEGPG
jgi:hypothetical protein